MKGANGILEFLKGYPPEVGDTVQRLRKIITGTIPDAREELDLSGKVIGYGLGPGYAGLICTIIPSKKGVKLGVVRGAQLPDAARLLEGSGKQHRYVAFMRPSDVERPGLQSLLRAAVKAWQDRSGQNG
jgi:hypothetical protein